YSHSLQYLPLPPIIYAIFVGAVIALFLLIQIGVLSYAYGRIGLSPMSATIVLLASLLGSYVNIPVAHLADERVVSQEVIEFFGERYIAPVVVDWPGTILAVNVGGAVIPFLLSIYLLFRNRIWIVATAATAIVAVVVHLFARIVPGVGISVPIFAPPLLSAALAIVLSRDFAAPVAYVSGSLGTLIGADLLNLGRIHEIETPIASFGGAGTFDGIFVTGILAVLIASLRLRRKTPGVSPTPP
ncbi:MAG: DUF1614 domain-containing protein, partial [Methylocystis sp.]|uniref:DUF1614 domain-containing protein n=1 Tax=Methylocystis sp. TaxID=1911079 RepID=UPI003D0E3D48